MEMHRQKSSISKSRPQIKNRDVMNTSFANDGFYDIMDVHDPLARPSKHVGRSNIRLQEGDGDIWYEKVYCSPTTGQKKIYFCSQKTGKKVRDEPPSGASRVIYLNESGRKEKIRRIDARYQTFAHKE
mmetsp:Transcript_3417/g.4771  ORF Transcript_3417/g.4771 Transcript_3417/m.4771 type:complete len:128 (+) Transcript_3417:251-634(+)